MHSSGQAHGYSRQDDTGKRVGALVDELISLAVPNLTGREGEYLQECVSTTFVSSVGPFVTRFERAVAASAGCQEAVAVTSGTTGLHLALHSLGVRQGDLVALPSLTFVATANAVAQCGATPWLFDVTDESWTLDPEQLRRVLAARIRVGRAGPTDDRSGRRLAAILPVHTLGHPADMDAIVEVATYFETPVVADAAAALGAEYRTRPIGQTGACLSVFSFNGNKTVTAGGGGALVSEDVELLARARHLSTQARISRDYDHDEIGFNYRLTNLQAAVGCAQMEQLDTFVRAKRRIHDHYHEALGGLPGVQSFPQARWASSSCWLSGAFLKGWDPVAVKQLRQRLWSEGIDVRPFWKPMHLQQPFERSPREPTPVTDRIWQRILTLPCSSGITDRDLETVTHATRRAIQEVAAP